MELRGQDKEIRPMPSSLGYNPHHPHMDSSSAAPVVERRRHQNVHAADTISFPTGNPPDTHLYHHQLNPHQHINNKPRINPDPDPVPAPISTTIATLPPTISRSSNQRSPPQPPSTTAINTAPLVRYRECLKNHAASKGCHVVDGCGEFMPSGQEDTPEALKCAACECHRSFHRKEIDGESQYAANRYTLPPPQQIQIPPQQQQQQQSSFHHHHRFPYGYSTSTPSTVQIAPNPMMMAFGGGGGLAESSSEDLNMFQSNNGGGQTSGLQQRPMSKKRYRTKFNQEQKEKMFELAEKLGWKIQKQDEEEVRQFCSQVNVKRQAFKVWMHNNKQAMKKKQTL